MATRRKNTQAEAAQAEEVTITTDTETDTMSDVLDDVVETDESAPVRGRPGRKPNQLKAAALRFASAKDALVEARKPRPSVEEAEAEFENARAELHAAMETPA
jgi:hypothetical protein